MALAVDPVLSRELKSLEEEIAASQRARVQRPPNGAIASEAEAARPAAAAPNQAEEADEDQRSREDLHAFVDEATQFFEEAEKNISAHPGAAVVGALVLGILIGRALGRRRELKP